MSEITKIVSLKQVGDQGWDVVVETDDGKRLKTQIMNFNKPTLNQIQSDFDRWPSLFKAVMSSIRPSLSLAKIESIVERQLAKMQLADGDATRTAAEKARSDAERASQSAWREKTPQAHKAAISLFEKAAKLYRDAKQQGAFQGKDYFQGGVSLAELMESKAKVHEDAGLR